MSDYNGWTNWETWNVSLWVGNEEAVYSDMARQSRRKTCWTASEAKDFVEEWFPNGTPDMESMETDPYDKDEVRVNWQEIADSFSEECEQAEEKDEE